MTKLTRRAALMLASGTAAAAALRTATPAAAQSEPARLIDLHAHAVPPAMEAALDQAGTRVVDGRRIPAWTAQQALADMDEAGIATQALSLPDPGLTAVSRSQQAGYAAACNNELAGIAAAHPGRFTALAVLPLSDPRRAVRELHRARKLGYRGVILPTNVDGRYLGDPKFELLMFELNRLGMLALVHPVTPANQDQPEWLDLPPALLEQAFEPVRAAASLLYTLTLTRYPRIRFILADGGGALPFLWYRVGLFTLNSGISNLLQRPYTLPAPLNLQRGLARLTVDTAHSTAPANLISIRHSVGVTRLTLGTDYPFKQPADHLAELANGLGEAETKHVTIDYPASLLNLAPSFQP